MSTSAESQSHHATCSGHQTIICSSSSRVCSIYCASTSSVPHWELGWASMFRAVSVLSFFGALPCTCCPFHTHYLAFSCSCVHNWMPHKPCAKRILQSFREIQLFHVYVYKRHTRNRTQQHWLCTEAEHLLHSSCSDTGDTRLPFSAFIPSREKIKAANVSVGLP